MLTNDIEDIIDCVTFLNKGILHPRLLPQVEKIINNLKEIKPYLTEGLHFPFVWYKQDN